VLASHSFSGLTVNLASKFKSIQDLDNFGEIVQFSDIVSETVIETSYFEDFLLAIIVINDSSHSVKLIS
jgi:hypothetical protein